MITWEIVQYIRDLYSVTDYTMLKLVDCVYHKFGIRVNFTTIHKICRNKRWYDEKYQPPNKPYRKITVEIKEFILNSTDSDQNIARYIKNNFKCNISITRIKQLKETSKQQLSLIIS